MKKTLSALTIALCMATSSSAMAWNHEHHERYESHGWHHGHDEWSFGLFLGAPLIQPSIYVQPPVYVSPAPVYVEPAPVYRNIPNALGTWYYCRPLNVYYPQTQACPTPWETVYPPR